MLQTYSQTILGLNALITPRIRSVKYFPISRRFSGAFGSCESRVVDCYDNSLQSSLPSTPNNGEIHQPVLFTHSPFKIRVPTFTARAHNNTYQPRQYVQIYIYLSMIRKGDGFVYIEDSGLTVGAPLFPPHSYILDMLPKAFLFLLSNNSLM